MDQVGGHGAWDEKQRMLVDTNGCILKILPPPPRGEREVNFYKDINSSEDPGHAQFLPWVPGYHGVSEKSGGNYLILENLTHGYGKPCVLDIKMGVRTYGPDASEEKKAKQDASYRGTKIPFGFSVPGLIAYTGKEKSEQIKLDKTFGKSLDKDNITSVFDLYLDTENKTEHTKTLARIFLSKLKEFQEMYEQQKTYHIFGSSLLFVYDASAIICKEKAESLHEHVTLKMIDFAHVHPANEELDENYLIGLRSLIKIFSEYAGN